MHNQHTRVRQREVTPGASGRARGERSIGFGRKYEASGRPIALLLRRIVTLDAIGGAVPPAAAAIGASALCEFQVRRSGGDQ